MDENNNIEAVNNPSSSGIFFRLLSNKKLLLGALIILVLLVIFAVFSFFSIQKNNKIAQARNDVYQKLKIGDYKGAQEAAKKGLAIKKDDEYLIKNFINAVSSQGNKTGKEIDALKISEPYIKELLKGNNSADDLLTAGYAYETAGQYEKALTYYENSISKNPKLSEAYFHKGHVLAFLNRESESQQAYERAYELDPNNPLIILMKATILNKNNSPDDSLNLLLKVGDNESFDKDIRAESYTAASLLEMNRGNNLESKKYAEKAFRTGSEYSTGTALYGYYIGQEKNRYNEGIGYLTSAIKQNPRITFNYLLLGILLRTYNYPKQAVIIQKEGLDRIGEDNTIIGNSAKSAQKGKMYYEIAQTYSFVPDVDNSVKYLKLAIAENSLYESDIQKDLKTGYFNKIKINPIFVNFVNSK